MMEEEIKPVVYASTQKHGIREGRGFSLEEINRAGLTLDETKMLKIPIDKRRTTAHLNNIQTLKEHFGTSIPLPEISGIGKTTEEKLKRAGISDAYDLAHADINTLAEKVPYSSKTLKRWQGEARKLLRK
ncbi:MAG: ribosomal protein L13e [Candidatus Bathyarchaeia archaeon]